MKIRDRQVRGEDCWAGARVSHSSTQRVCLWRTHRDEAAMVLVSVEQKVRQHPLPMLKHVGSGVGSRQQLQISREALYSKIGKTGLYSVFFSYPGDY